MAELKGHWTNRSTADFVYRIGFDFVAQLENYLEADGTSRDEFATALGVSKGRVSQILNDPGNLRLKTIVECVRAIGRKVAIVAYDDGDKNNDSGPVNSGIFSQCWNDCGRPTEFKADNWTAVEPSVSIRYYTGVQEHLNFFRTPWLLAGEADEHFIQEIMDDAAFLAAGSPDRQTAITRMEH